MGDLNRKARVIMWTAIIVIAAIFSMVMLVLFADYIGLPVSLLMLVILAVVFVIFTIYHIVDEAIK